MNRRFASAVAVVVMCLVPLTACGSGHSDNHHTSDTTVVHHVTHPSSTKSAKAKVCKEKKKYDRKGRLKSHKKVCK